MSALPDLMRRVDRKLDIQRGLSLSYDDLVLMRDVGMFDALRQAAEDEARANELPPIPRGRVSDPFIYFIRAGEGPIKIGLSRSVKDRCAGLQICTAEPLSILASIRATKEAERGLHRFFEPERIRGEWFRASPRLLTFIGRVAVQ